MTKAIWRNRHNTLPIYDVTAVTDWSRVVITRRHICNRFFFPIEKVEMCEGRVILHFYVGCVELGEYIGQVIDENDNVIIEFNTQVYSA